MAPGGERYAPLPLSDEVDGQEKLTPGGKVSMSKLQTPPEDSDVEVSETVVVSEGTVPHRSEEQENSPLPIRMALNAWVMAAATFSLPFCLAMFAFRAVEAFGMAADKAVVALMTLHQALWVAFFVVHGVYVHFDSPWAALLIGLTNSLLGGGIGSLMVHYASSAYHGGWAILFCSASCTVASFTNNMGPKLCLPWNRYEEVCAASNRPTQSFQDRLLQSFRDSSMCAVSVVSGMIIWSMAVHLRTFFTTPDRALRYSSLLVLFAVKMGVGKAFDVLVLANPFTKNALDDIAGRISQVGALRASWRQGQEFQPRRGRVNARSSLVFLLAWVQRFFVGVPLQLMTASQPSVGSVLGTALVSNAIEMGIAARCLINLSPPKGKLDGPSNVDIVLRLTVLFADVFAEQSATMCAIGSIAISSGSSLLHGLARDDILTLESAACILLVLGAAEVLTDGAILHLAQQRGFNLRPYEEFWIRESCLFWPILAIACSTILMMCALH